MEFSRGSGAGEGSVPRNQSINQGKTRFNGKSLNAILQVRESLNDSPIPSRHRLWLRLRRYLIVFAPLTFVLDQ